MGGVLVAAAKEDKVLWMEHVAIPTIDGSCVSLSGSRGKGKDRSFDFRRDDVYKRDSKSRLEINGS